MSQIEREALALVFGVTKFHQYLFGNDKFILVTDHKPLVKLFGEHEGIPATASARISRWALRLSAYNYTIQYRSTTQIGHADGLSRLPLPVSKERDHEVSEMVCLLQSLEEEFALDSSRIAALTSRDTLLSRVRQAIETGEWPDEEDIRSFFHRRDELSVIRGVLLWGSRVVVPAKAQKHVLHELHEGHPGVRPPGHHRLGQRSGLHRGGVPAVHEEERHPSCEDGSSQAGVRQSLRQRLRERTGLVARSGRLSPRCNDGGGPAGRWSTVAPSLRSAAVCGRLCSEESHGDGRLRLRTAAGEAGPVGWRAGRELAGGRSAGGSRGDLGPETGG
ncbi:uncharacterized protein LOC122381027 isoform X3 [Amphibalanus amphitrite]|uniref:uncharacterized protein LOC122381027 isoform X3 n=1 Tax=Amphibalanus amphitrite TaxID=1232801 RepID=UPI001C91B49E|nr:uncharacterized protein LOC122381027 isoform X3 [Amphibalanus amphitrite]